MPTMNPFALPDKWKNFWARFYGKMCKGDIIEWAERRTVHRGVYYSHYQLHDKVHLIVARSFNGGTVQAFEELISIQSFKDIRIIKRAEEIGSLVKSIEEYQEMVKLGYA